MASEPSLTTSWRKKREIPVDKIDDVAIGDVVFVRSKGETGAVVGKTMTSLRIRLLTGTIDVQEGDFELRG